MSSKVRVGAFVLIPSLIIGALALAGPGAQAAPTPKGSPVLIAGVVGASGAYGSIGINMINAGKLAIEQINKNGGLLGRPAVWKYADDQGNPTLAAQLVQKFAGQGAISIVGSGDAGPAVAAMAVKIKIPAIGIVDGGGPTIYPGGPGTPPLKWIFGYSTSTYALGGVLADYALAHCTKTAVLHDQTSYGVGASQAIEYGFKKAGKKLVLNDTITEDWSSGATVDVTPQVKRVQDTGADCVIPWLNPANAARFVQTASTLGAKFTYLANDAAYGDLTFAKLSGASANGVVSAQLAALIQPNAGLKKYQADYKAQFGAEADIYGAQTYDSIMMLAEAVNKGKSLIREKIRLQFEMFNGYQGNTGVYGFSKSVHESSDPKSFTFIKYDAAKTAWVPISN